MHRVRLTATGRRTNFQWSCLGLHLTSRHLAGPYGRPHDVSGRTTMTNYVTPLPAISPGTNVRVHVGCTDYYQPIPITSIIWFLSIVLVLACIGIFINCAIRVRRKLALSWQPTLLSLAALAIVTTTLVLISTSLRFTLHFADAPTWGAFQKAMCQAELTHASSAFAIGISSSAICLALAIMSRRLKEKQETR